MDGKGSLSLERSRRMPFQDRAAGVNKVTAMTNGGAEAASRPPSLSNSSVSHKL